MVAVAGAGVGAHGQTMTVTTLDDISDFGGARQVGDLPGADGLVSFREAVTAANNTPGPQTIEFAIPSEDWWLVDDYALLRLEEGAFVLTDDGTTLDFLSQADYTGDTNPDGTEVGIYGLESNGWGAPAIIIQASNCVVRGLGQVHQRGSSVSVWSGNDNLFVGNVTESIELNPYPGTTSGNVIGGTDPADANDIDLVRILCGANDNLVIGNRLRSVSVLGSRYCLDGSRYPLRNRIGGPTPQERNVLNGFGSYGHEGFPVGYGVRVEWARDTIIEGNFIGVTEDGTARVTQRGPTGVEVADAYDTTVRGNLIAGLRVVGTNHYAGQVFGQAILVTSLNEDNFGVTIEGNLIGTDVTGTNPITTRAGIVVAPLSGARRIHDTRIGDNIIGFTELRGVAVSNLIQDVEITGNSIFANGALGIDLATSAGYDGVTSNDPGDGDSGANGLQNFPVIDLAETDGATVRITGILDSRPSRDYRVEFFASASCDPSGHGEGERFLGSTTATTDGSGDALIDVTVPGSVAVGEFITATATELSAGATSEFSACVAATEGGCAADLDGDGDADADDFFDYLDLFAADDPASDLDGDGDTDADDFFAYLDLFAAGC